LTGTGVLSSQISRSAGVRSESANAKPRKRPSLKMSPFRFFIPLETNWAIRAGFASS
jgi:hypothetical protein